MNKKNKKFSKFFLPAIILGLVLISFSLWNVKSAKTADTSLAFGESMRDTKIKAEASIAVLGLGITDSTGSATLDKITVTVTAGEGGFTPGDLANLGTATSSGIALFRESNNLPGWQGQGNNLDYNVKLNAAPTWSGNGPWTVELVPDGTVTLPTNTGNQPFNFYLVVTASTTPTNGHQFTVSIASAGHIQTSEDATSQPSVAINSQEITIDTQPPAAQAAPTVSDGNGISILTWSANSSADVIQYWIYRSDTLTAATSSYSLVGTSTITSFTDAVSNDTGSYYYYVLAEDEAHNLSLAAATSTVNAASGTNQRPSKPTNSLPPHNADNLVLQPKLEASDFSDADGSHKATHWQITQDYAGTNWEPAMLVWDGLSTSAETSTTTPEGVLDEYRPYWWRVRYQDNDNAWSEWSEPTKFITGGAGATGSNNPNIVEGVNGISSLSVSLSHYGTSEVSQYTFSFKTTTNLPIGSQIHLGFPSGIDLTNATATVAFNSDINGSGDTGTPGAGTPQISEDIVVSGQTITLTTTAAQTNDNSILTVVVGGITNPSTAGVYRPFWVWTTQSDGTLINGSSEPMGMDGPGGAIVALAIGGTYSVTGTVKDASNNGLEGLVVGMGSPEKMYFVGTQTTASDGSYTFSHLLPGRYMIFVDPQDPSFFELNNYLMPMVQEINVDGNETVDFTCQTSDATISGSISNGPANQPINIMANNGQSMSMTQVFLDSNGSGSYTLRATQNSTWSVQIFTDPMAGEGAQAGTDFVPPGVKTVAVGSGDVTGVDLAYVQANKVIHVYVQNAATNAYITSGVFVSIRNPGSFEMGPPRGTDEAASGENYYELKAAEGSYVVEVFSMGKGEPITKPILVTSAHTVDNPLEVTVKISLPSTYITGTVTDANGAPIGGAAVEAHSSFGGGFSMVNSNGQYTIYVPEGTYTVEAFAPGYGHIGSQSNVSVTSDSSPTVNFSVANITLSTISGQVTVGGSGLAGVQVFAFSSAGGNHAVTDANGNYSMNVKAGTGYTIGAWSSEIGEIGKVTDVDVSSDVVQNFSVDDNYGTLEVTLTGGASLTDAFVDAFDNTNHRGNHSHQGVISSGNSVYTLKLLAGEYDVFVGHPGFGSICQRTGDNAVEITANQTTSISCAITNVGGLATLSGTVTSGGSPVEGIEVFAFNPNGPGGGRDITDSSGNYTIYLKKGNTYKVGISKTGYQPHPLDTVVLDANATNNFYATTSSYYISGTVYRDAEAVSGAKVWAKSDSGERTFGVTDASGGYQLPVSDTSTTWHIQAVAKGTRQSVPVAVSFSGSNVTAPDIYLVERTDWSSSAKIQSIIPASGGVVEFGDFKLKIPANALGTGTNPVQVKVEYTTAAAEGVNGRPLGIQVPSITATDSQGQTITNLNSPVEIVVPYNESDIPSGVDEDELKLGYFDETSGTWIEIPSTVNTTLNVIVGSTSHFSDFAPSAPTDAAAPDTPTGLSAIGGQNQITLTWDANSESDLAGYYIYRDTSSSGSFPYLTQVSSSTTSYVDSGLGDEVTYYYKITAYDSSGYESAATAAVSATTNPAPSSAPSGGVGPSISSPNPPQVTSQSIIINNGDAQTNSRQVTLTLLAENAVQMAISNSADFTGIGWEDYATSKIWTLTEGDGEKTVYVKFRSADGNVSEVVSDTITLVTGEEAPALPAEKEVAKPELSELSEGDLIRGPDGIKVYIINAFGYKRHIFNPAVFNMYGHLKWENIKEVDQATLDSYTTSDLYRADGDYRVYSLEEVDEAKGIAVKHHLNMTPVQFKEKGYCWEQVFIVNQQERDYYQTGQDLTF